MSSSLMLVDSFSAFQDVGPKSAPAGPAAPGAPAPAAGGASTPGMGMAFLPMLLLIPFLFLSFRRQKKERQARGTLKKGDKIVTASGIIGELTEIDERIGKVKIAPGTTIQVLASSISPYETAVPAEKKTAKDLDDLKEAKAVAADKK